MSDPLPRWRRAVARHAVLITAAALALVALALGLAVSGRTAPAFDELGRLDAVLRGATVIWHLAEHGPSVLVSSSAAAAYEAFGDAPPALVLAGGWARLSLGRLGLLDLLTAQRLGWLLLSALAPAALYALVEPFRGRRAALAAAVLLLVMPPWLHAAAVSHPAVAVATAWLLVLAAYVRGLPPSFVSRRAAPGRRPATVVWAAAGALALGFGVAVSLATLWVLAIILPHFWSLRWRATRRAFGRGRAPTPAFLLWAVPLAPVAVLALSPQLWRGEVKAAARWLLSPLGPAVSPFQYRGRLVDGASLPAGFALEWVVATVPLVVGVLALAGVWRLLRDFRARRADRPAAGRGLGALVALGLAVTAVLPPLLPDVLAVVPPRAHCALPFVAILAGVGVDAVSRRVLPSDRSAWLAGAMIGAVALAGLREPGTAAAAYSLCVGGTRSVVASGLLPPGDGSELGALLPALDALDSPELRIAAPDVPPAFWEAVHRSRRLEKPVRPVARAAEADLVLARGDSESALARVVRGGAVLWSLRPAG